MRSAQVVPASLCVEWSRPDGSTRSRCDATDDIAATYRRALAETAVDESLSAMFFAPPTGSDALNAAALTEWLDRCDRLESYLRTEFASADLVQGSQARAMSRYETIAGIQDGKLSSLNTAVETVFAGATAKVNDYVTARLGFPEGVLNHRRRARAALDPLLSWTRERLLAVSGDMSRHLKAFKSLRDREGAIRASLQTWSAEASNASLADAGAKRLAITRAMEGELEELDTLSVAFQQSLAQVRVAQDNYYRAIAPYELDLMAMGASDPLRRAFEVLLNSGRNAVAYLEARRSVEQQGLRRITEGLDRRMEVLRVQAGGAETRAAIEATRTNVMSAQFLDDVSSKLASVRSPSRKSTRLGLPFLYGKVEENLAVVDLETLCVGSKALPWMTAGCAALSQEVSKAQMQLTTGIPNAMRVGMIALKRAGVPDDMLRDLEAQLSQKKVREAAITYDAALRSTDAANDRAGGTP